MKNQNYKRNIVKKPYIKTINDIKTKNIFFTLELTTKRKHLFDGKYNFIMVNYH